MTLEEIFNEETMLAYSNACLDLAIDIPEKRKKHGFDTLVIPSRGAVPFFLGMVHALENLKNYGDEYEDFHRNLGVQPMLTPLLPENSTISNSVRGKKYRVLLVPFTADLNIPKFDSKENSA